MGFFTKTEETHFRRNEAGKVIAVEHKSDAVLNAERIDRGEDRFSRMKQKLSSAAQHGRENFEINRALRKEQREHEKEAYRTSYNKARIERISSEGRTAGSMPRGSGLMQIPFIQQAMNPPRLQTKVVHVHHHHGQKKSHHKKQKPKRPQPTGYISPIFGR